ncbi:MAG: cysteine-rich CWC family protein [Psychromonas sp.]
MPLDKPIENNEKLCPFCHAENNCMAGSKSPCWCFAVQIPDALTDLVPVALKGKSCICISCINAFKTDQNLFKQKYVHEKALD